MVKIEFYKTEPAKPKGQLFMVCLCKLPALPKGIEIDKALEERTMLALVRHKYTGKYFYASLDPETAELVGNILVENKAADDEWNFIDVTQSSIIYPMNDKAC